MLNANEICNMALTFVKDHKAQIMIGAGIICNTAATIFACKQTLTAKDIIDDHNERRDEIEDAKQICKREIQIYDIASGKDKEHVTNQEPCSDENYEKYHQYLDKDCKKDVFKTYMLTGLKFIRHYAVPATLYIGGICLTCIGTGVLTKKVAGLTTSLASVTAAFADYRDRVKNVIGEEAENRIFTNEQVETKKYKDVDDDGNEIEKEETVIKTDCKYDPYALLLDRNSPAYRNDIDATLTELKLLEKELNQRLRATGEVILNEVFEALGYAKTEIGAHVGWKYSPYPEEQKKYGDGYISFGLFDHKDEKGNILLDPENLTQQWTAIRNSHTSNRQSDTDEYDIWLHFNVDGPITQLMDKRPGRPL